MREPARTTNGGQEKALHEALAQKTPASTSQGGADCEFFAPCRRARNQEIGNVEAGDKKYAACCGEQHIKRALDVANHAFKEGAGICSAVDKGVVEIGFVKPVRDQGQVRDCGMRCGAREQSSHSIEVVNVKRP